MKNQPETIRFVESKENLNKVLWEALKLELEEMKTRGPEREDPKFRVLEEFVSKKQNQPFERAFEELGKDTYKHAIITRLENQAKHMGGRVPYSFIRGLEQALYGIDRWGHINFQRKMELERQLQSEN